MNKFPKKGVKATIIVAHPDDETIFCGGTMLTYPEWEWNIICMTHRRESIRGIQFRRAIKYLEFFGVNVVSNTMSGMEDEGQDLTDKDKDKWKSALMHNNIKSDVIFTHNSKGDYLANHHIELNKIVRELYEGVWEFICPAVTNIVPVPFREEISVVPLSRNVLDKKTELFNRCYTSELLAYKNLPEVMVYEFKTGPEIFTS